MNDNSSSDKANGESSTSKLVLAKRKYKELPKLRRQDFCSALIVAHVVALFVVGYVPYLFPIGIVTTFGVIIVCISVLTGPVFMNQLDFKTGELMQWGLGNKIAAVVFLVLFVGGFGFLAYRLFWHAT